MMASRAWRRHTDGGTLMASHRWRHTDGVPPKQAPDGVLDTVQAHYDPSVFKGSMFVRDMQATFYTLFAELGHVGFGFLLLVLALRF